MLPPSGSGIVPELIQALMTNNHPKSKEFLSHIRRYNSGLAFCSMGAQLGSAAPAGRCPYVFTIHGQIYHNTSVVRPGDDAATPKYAQLYILDSTQANEHRMNFAPNQVCDGELMSQLDALIRQVNPYANIYKNLREMIEEEERLSVAEGRPRMQVGMVIHNDRKTQDERRYDSPTGDDIAFIFKSPDGIPPENRDVV